MSTEYRGVIISHEDNLSTSCKFDLVNHIKCDTLDVSYGFKRRGYIPVVKSLIDNRDYYCFNHLKWAVNQDSSLTKGLISNLLDLARNQLTIYNFGRELSLRKKEYIRELIEEDRRLKTIDCQIKMPKTLFETVLKQVVNGDRPNLSNFTYHYDKNHHSDGLWLRTFLQEEFPDNLISVKQASGHFSYLLTTSDSRKITIGYVLYKGEVCFCMILYEYDS